MKKNTKRLLALLVCLPLLCGVIFFTAKREKANAASSYTITTSKTLQKFDGWGTSLIWWANNVGKYDWEAGSGDMTVREEIMELLYGKDGLEYNIARFNVGGGDNPHHDHVTKPQHMEGYSALDEAYLPKYDANVNTEVGYWGDYKDAWTMRDVTYDWEKEGGLTADAAQRWCMEWIYQNAEKLGTQEELITEYFSNSPPWYMTNSACASGGVGSDDANGKQVNNLLEGREDEFAKYFVDVLYYLVTEQGYKFDYINPFNESTSGWWPARSQKQEGCYLTDKQRADVLVEVVKLLDSGAYPELADVKIAFDDSTGASKAWAAYSALKNTYSAQYNKIKHRIGKLNYHLYEGNESAQKSIAKEAGVQDWQNWMSEMGYHSEKTATSSSLQTGYLHTDQIRTTIYNGANAYVLWQVIEELSSQLNAPEHGYGPVKVSYYSASEVPDLVNYGYDLGSYYVSKQYYMLGQYSKYIRPGYHILATSDGKGVAAISPDGTKVVLVHTNNSTSGEYINVALDGHYITGGQVIVTDEDQSWAKASLAASGGSFSYKVNPYSVTTFVLDVVPNQMRTISVKSGGAYSRLASGVALPKIDEIQEGAYANDRIYLTNGWSGKSDGTGFSGDSQWVKGNTDGSVGAFITFTHATEADFVFRCKETGAADAGTLKFELYEDGVLKQEQSDLKATNATKDSYQIIWSANGLDMSKTYVVRIIVIDNQWTNLSRVDLRNTDNKAAPALTRATIKDNKLYVDVNDTTTTNQYKVFWREVGTNDVQGGDVKTVAEMRNKDNGVATLTGKTYEVWVTDTAETKKSITVLAGAGATDEKLLYYVNAGASEVGNYSIYERAGVNNTFKDQAYGVDPVTGKSWGRTSENNATYMLGKVDSVYEAIAESVSTDKAVSSGSNGTKIEYQFELDGGNTYDIMLGAMVKSDWSKRSIKVSINGTVNGTYAIDKSESLISISNVTPSSGTITIKVESATSGQGALLGTIMIAKHGDTAKAFATAAEWTEVTTGQHKFGAVSVNYDAVIDLKEAYVYNVDGTHTKYEENVTFNRFALTDTTPNTELARITGSVDGLYFSTAFELMSEASIYYFVDCGTNGTNPAPTIGSLQNGVYDQQSDGTSWGYSASGANHGWQSDDYINSMHHDITDSFYYTFTNLPKGEHVNIEVGGRSFDDWGDRTYDVYFGSSKTKYDAKGNVNIGEVDLPKGGMPKLVAENVEVPESTCYMFFHKTSGDGPSVCYISIASSGDPVPAAPTLGKSEGKPTDTVNLSGLPVGDLLVINADDGSRICEMKITSTVPEETVTSMDVDLSKIDIPEGSQAVLFSVRHFGSLEESKASIYAFPSVLVSGIKEEWSDKMVLHFTPSMGVTLQKLVVESPAGKRLDVTKREYFNYVARESGEYILTLTTKANEVYTQTVNIDKIDVVTIGVALSNANPTDQDVDVTVSLDYSAGALKTFEVGTLSGTDYVYAEKPLDDNTYSFTADKNATYMLKATSQGGNEYLYELNITNIDKEGALYTVSPDFASADGFTAALISNNISGGTFSVKKGEVGYGGINGLHLVEAGDYTVTYTSGTGKEASFTVKLGYGGGALGSLSGKTLSNLSNAQVYRMGTGEEIEVSGGSCTLTAGYRYMIVAKTGNDYEVQIVTVEASATNAPAAKPAKKGCGSAAGAALPMAAIVLLLAGATLALAKKGGKRA